MLLRVTHRSDALGRACVPAQAHGYDLSQERLGVALKALGADGLPTPDVITKLDSAVQDALSAEAVATIVDASVANSAAKLGLSPVPCVCLHQWARHGPSLHGGAAYDRLKQLKTDGVCVCDGGSPWLALALFVHTLP